MTVSSSYITVWQKIEPGIEAAAAETQAIAVESLRHHLSLAHFASNYRSTNLRNRSSCFSIKHKEETRRRMSLSCDKVWFVRIFISPRIYYFMNSFTISCHQLSTLETSSHLLQFSIQIIGWTSQSIYLYLLAKEAILLIHKELHSNFK